MSKRKLDIKKDNSNKSKKNSGPDEKYGQLELEPDMRPELLKKKQGRTSSRIIKIKY